LPFRGSSTPSRIPAQPTTPMRPARHPRHPASPMKELSSLLLLLDPPAWSRSCHASRIALEHLCPSLNRVHEVLFMRPAPRARSRRAEHGRASPSHLSHPKVSLMTPRQLRFVEEYACLRNAAEAVRRAGYSPFNAAVRGTQLLRSPSVAAALRAAGVDVPPPARARSICRDGQGLTERQRRFVEQYLICGNASEAARRAGYSALSCKSAASQLTRSPRVAAALQAAKAARAQRTHIDAVRVLEEVARLSFVDLASLIDWSGEELRLRAPDEIAPEDRAALAQVTLSATKSGKRVT